MITKEQRASQKYGMRWYVRVERSVRTEKGPRHQLVENFGFEPVDVNERGPFWARVQACEDKLQRQMAQERKQKRAERAKNAKSSKPPPTASKTDSLGSENVGIQDAYDPPADAAPLTMTTFGPSFIKGVLRQLKLPEFFAAYEADRGFKSCGVLYEAFELLTCNRALNPGSIRSQVARCVGSYGQKQLSLRQTYRALDHFAGMFYDLQEHVFKEANRIFPSANNHVVFDVTNVYVCRDFPHPDDIIVEDGEPKAVPGLAQRGVSKEHRTEPIIQVGMATTPLGLPAAIDVFPGNTADGQIAQEMFPFVKKLFGEGCNLSADKGCNSVRTQVSLLDEGWDFTFSQTLRGTHGKRFLEELFSGEEWHDNPSGSFSWKLYEDTRETVVTVKDPQTGKTKREKRTIPSHVLLTWDAARAKVDRKRRDDKLKKAEKQVKSRLYGLTPEVRGVSRYIRETAVDTETGEVVTEKLKKNKSINLEQAEEDARFDGFVALVTSQQDPDVDVLLYQYARQLVVEDLFRNVKSGLEMRPVYVRTRAHLRAHFLICFIALLVVQMIRLAMSRHNLDQTPISVERLQTALNAFTCLSGDGDDAYLLPVGGRKEYAERLSKYGNTYTTLNCSFTDQIAHDNRRVREAFEIQPMPQRIAKDELNGILSKLELKSQWTTCA